MQYSTYFALFASAVIALPLNINLGAYSPALVVGDGEISFGGGEEAAALIGTLQGASAGTGAAAAKAAEVAKGTTIAESAAIQPGDIISSESAIPLVGMGKSANTPRDPEVDTSNTAIKEKRDLAGFNAALAYSTGALTKGPTIELGTGEGGSGVGITVKPGAITRDLNEATIERRDGENGPTVTLLKIRTLSKNSSPISLRGEKPVKRSAIEIDQEGNLDLNLDDAVEMVIAEVKA